MPKLTKRDLLEALTDITWQFAYRTTRPSEKRLGLWTGGLSALEGAFVVLGWDDPHWVEVEENACEVEECYEWADSGMFWGDGYFRLCTGHGLRAFRKEERPPMRAHALEREKTRQPDGRLPVG